MGVSEFIILFRESLEVILVLGVILTVLYKTKNQKYQNFVWFGVLAGLSLSVVFAYFFQFNEEIFEQNDAIYEGVLMVSTTILMTWFIAWMIKQKDTVESIKKGVKNSLSEQSGFGLFIFTTIAVVREGVEAVLFIVGIFLNTGSLSLVGALAGVLAAVLIGILLFKYCVKSNIGLFFKITTIFLALLAAGLFSQGIHELQEAKVLPVWINHVYDINPQANFDGTYPILHENGEVGGVFKGLIGYDGNPSDLQLIAYFAYLYGIFLYYKKHEKIIPIRGYKPYL
ncbi:MAG: FTR1 family protein [Candidatus Micrarchaeia archaeon]